MEPEGHKNPLGPLVETLISAFGDKCHGVVLFGSRATENDRPDSDWDVLLVAEDLPARPMERHRFLLHILPAETRDGVSLLARTPEEFSNQFSTLFIEIATTGKILHDPFGTIEARLLQLRTWAVQARWVRVRDGTDVYWVSQDPKPLGWLRKGA